ncbi:MAG: hypothetical protein WCC10_15130 [Tumebacillaceae bacterium]
MQEFHQAEYCDMELVLGRRDLEQFIGQLASGGVSLYWKDRSDRVVLVATTGQEKKEFCFSQSEGQFHLTGSLTLHDKRLVSALQQALEKTKGHAIVKYFSEGPILISKFRNGEALQIMELHGPRKKIVYEKPIKVTADDVMRALKSRDVETRIPVLRIELDYELVSLSDALATGDQLEAQRIKARLEELRREMLMLEVISQKTAEV